MGFASRKQLGCGSLGRVFFPVLFLVSFGVIGTCIWINLCEGFGYTRHATGRTRVVIMTTLPEGKDFGRIFELLFFPSWRWVVYAWAQSKPRVIPDLFIACEGENACDQVRDKCILYEERTHKVKWYPQCFYKPIVRAQHTYRFLSSVDFLLGQPATSILNSNDYEYVLRTDLDAILFPGINQYVPAGNGVVGEGFAGDDFAKAVVGDMVHKYVPWERGYNITKTNVQSTFYVKASIAQSVVKTIVNVTETLFENAFTSQACSDLVNNPIRKLLLRNATTQKSVCKWPRWHRGVASLYGTMAAASKFGLTIANQVDAYAAPLRMPSMNTSQLVQAHLVDQKHSLLQFLNIHGGRFCDEPTESIRHMHADGLLTKWSLRDQVKLDQSPFDDSARYASPSQYVAFILWRALTSSCKTRNLVQEDHSTRGGVAETKHRKAFV